MLLRIFFAFLSFARGSQVNLTDLEYGVFLLQTGVKTCVRLLGLALIGISLLTLEYEEQYDDNGY